MDKIESLDCSKSVNGNVPTNMLKKMKTIACRCVTDCINHLIHDGIFQKEVKRLMRRYSSKWGKTTKKTFGNKHITLRV